jgi:predicted glycosyltransferase
MKGEIMPSLEWLKKNNNTCRIVLGMRDILDDPQIVIDLWRQQGTYDVIRDFYDRIFIYGTPSIFDPISSYEFPPEIKSKSQFCGYITDYDASNDSSEPRNRTAGDSHKFVVVTVGGGDGWGEDLISDFLEIIQKRKSNIPFKSLILTGPFLKDDQWNRFKYAARDLPVKILKFVRQTRPFLAQSDLVISTGGYNTITDILSYARKALVIPRIKYRKEQFLRAGRMSDLGLITLMHPDDVSARHLNNCASDLLASDGDSLVEARARKLIPLDGGRRLAEHLGDIFAEMESERKSQA